MDFISKERKKENKPHKPDEYEKQPTMSLPKGFKSSSPRNDGKGKPECYICRKELGKLSMKFSAQQIRDKHVMIPDGMTEEDKVCFNDFTALTNHKAGEDYKLKTRTGDYKQEWNKRGIIQFKNERIAILQRSWGSQVEFIIAYDDLTKEGYQLMAIDEGKEGGQASGGFTGGVNAYFYFQKMEFVR